MLTIGICDDSQNSRQSLRWLLERILEKRNMDGTFFEFSSGETLLQWMEKHPNEVDLLFLDIEMGELNGMDTARKLREGQSLLQIVFVTGFTEYVFDGYGVGALGYLMKPPRQEQLEDILTRTLANLRQEADRVFSCREGDRWFRIPHGEILYFESDRRKVTCVTSSRTYSFYSKLDEVARELEGAGFVRIHQRYLVRAAAIRQVCGSEALVGEVALPISRSCHQGAMLALARAALEGE